MSLNLIYLKLNNVYYSVCMWWPWVDFFNEVFLLQLVIVIIYMYIYNYNSIYYTLLYLFILFFLFGISLSVFQLELFTAFLWLIECSVIFVFLLLLFYLNIKNIYIHTNKLFFNYFILFFYFLYFIVIVPNTSVLQINLTLYFLLDNSYESIFNFLQNDLFVLFISYYVLNNIELIFIGFLLLVGSIVCVNLYSVNKNTRLQNYKSFFSVFNFFLDMCSFVFLRKQNTIKQGNIKSSLRIFLKK